MAVRLSWDSRVIGDSLKVYRDTSAFDFAGRPAALATIGASDTEYEDSTAGADTTFFYALGIVSGASEVMSALISIKTAPGTPSGGIADTAGTIIADTSGTEITDTT